LPSPRSIVPALTGVALCAAALAACGSSSSGSAAAGSASASGAAFPLQLGSGAAAVTLSHRPTRIVSLSPTATEDLFAIGAGGQVVAVDKDSDYPVNAPHTNIDPLSPNVEAISAKKPDLIIVDSPSTAFSKQMAELHIPILDEPAANNLAQAYQEIDDLGRATGRDASAQSLVASMKSRIATLDAEVQPRTPPLSYYYEISPDYYSATSATFIGSLLAPLGLKDVADAAGVNANGGYPQLSAETIVADRPDLIFLADTLCCQQSAATVAKRPGWSAIPAVGDGGVVALNDDIASRWGPRIVTLLSEVVAAVKRLPASSSAAATTSTSS
jgi:iron complex transport system substrate-binding protein